MSHELAEKIAGLASRVNNLAAHHTGQDSRELRALEDRLAKLQVLAIVQDLRSEKKEYKQALKGLNEAIAFIGDADKKINKVAKTIEKVAQAAKLADKAINALA